MSAQTNAVSEAGFGTAVVAESRMRATRPVYWSLKREMWEHWWVWGVPLIVAALVVVGGIFAAVDGKAMFLEGNPARQAMSLAGECNITGMLLMLSTVLVTVFYCLDALYGERRDRSILFWRSLPVSDTVTVLAKATIGIVMLPLLTFAIAFVTQWLLMAIDAATLAAHGRTLSVIRGVPLWDMQAALLYHLIAVHTLWYAPIYGWLLLVSAWARRVPILWAVLPPLVISLVERIAFNTEHFGHFIAYRLSAGPSGAGLGMQTGMMPSMAGAAVGQFFVSPGLWGGLFVTGLFLAGAVWLRRYRTSA